MYKPTKLKHSGALPAPATWETACEHGLFLWQASIPICYHSGFRKP